MDPQQRQTLLRMRQFGRSARFRQLRPMGVFAEEEIILPPGGPHPDKRYSLDRQPFCRPWFSTHAP